MLYLLWLWFITLCLVFLGLRFVIKIPAKDSLTSDLLFVVDDVAYPNYRNQRRNDWHCNNQCASKPLQNNGIRWAAQSVCSQERHITREHLALSLVSTEHVQMSIGGGNKNNNLKDFHVNDAESASDWSARESMWHHSCICRGLCQRWELTVISTLNGQGANRFHVASLCRRDKAANWRLTSPRQHWISGKLRGLKTHLQTLLPEICFSRLPL